MKRKLLLSFILFGLIALMRLNYGTVLAATITVSSSSLATVVDGFCSLPEAIANANDTATGLVYTDCIAGNPSTSPDTILLTVDISLNSILGNSDGVSGLPLINEPLIIDGQGHVIERNAAFVTCDGSTPSQEFRILEVNKTDLTLQNITLRNGCSSTSDGGAIFIDDGSLTIQNTTIENSISTSLGGAIYGDSQSSFILIDNSNFIGNTAQDGGAIFSRVQLDVLNGSTFTGNSATSDGGAILITNAATLTFDNSTADSNSATDFGGAITSRNGSLILIQNSSIISNNMAGSDGGGIYGNSTSAGVTITDSLIDGNNSGNDGGAVHSRAPLSITNSQISNNTAVGEGGGVRLTNGISLLIDSSLIENNSSGIDGGGVFIRDNSTLTIQNGTIIRNNDTANNGGGVYINSTTLSATIDNSTIDSNHSLGGDGGGVFSRISIDITASSIINNTAFVEGGGILIDSGTTLNLDASNVVGNSAEDGGGILLEDLTTLNALNGTIINNNTANNRGGGIFSLSNADINLINVSVNGNTLTAVGSDGAGIYQSAGNLVLITSDVSSNTAMDEGGGLRLGGALNASISASTFNQNSANHGGGIFATNSSTVTLDASTINNNTAVLGAGIYTASGANLSIENGSFVTNNNATNDGGGLYAEVSGTSQSTIVNSTFQGNIASNGAAAFSRADLFLMYSSFINNTATGNGGAIRQETNALFAHNSTFSGNSASLGAGISNGASATIEFSTIANNTGGSLHNTGVASILGTILFASSGSDCTGTVIDNAYNLAGDASCSLGGLSLNNTNPNIAALTNNGGLTDTHLPNFGSPAIDAAGVCPAPSEDQRHIMRPFNLACDIGAVESGVFVDLVLTHSDAPDPIFVGDAYAYNLSVQNVGTASATNVILSVNLPASANFVSASVGCSLSGSIVTCNMGTLATTVSRSISINLTCASSGSLLSNSSLSLSEIDSNTANNTATTATLCNPLATDTPIPTNTAIPPIVLAPTLNPIPSQVILLPSSTFTLTMSPTIRPSNTPSSTATSTSTATSSATASATNTTTATLTSTLNPSPSATLTGDMTATLVHVNNPVGAFSVNRERERRCSVLQVGLVCQSEGIYPPLQNQTIDTSKPYILKVAASNLTWGEGSEITWTIRVVNPTANTLRNIIVTDTLPENLELVSADAAYQAANDGNVRFRLGRLAAFEHISIQITTRVLDNSGTVINRVCLEYQRLTTSVCNQAQVFNIHNLPTTGDSIFGFWRWLILMSLTSLTLVLIGWFAWKMIGSKFQWN